MSRTRLALLAIVSIFATAVVLADAAGPAPRPAWLAAAVQRVAALRRAPAPATTEAQARVPPPRAPAAAPSSPVAPVSAPAPVSSAAAAPTPTPAPAPPAPPAAPKPEPSKVRHVFVIALRGAGYQATFGPQSPLPYLATDLRARGALLSGFHPVDAADLPNYLAFAGGLQPSSETRAECGIFADRGCVQPNTTLSLGDQVTSSGRSWRAYLEGMGDQPCVHPEDGAQDATLQATSGYVTRHNPFVYFHSLLDLGDCQANDVDLTRLGDDLKTARTTPNLAYIAPAVGDDLDAFLKTWVPQIVDSAAYKKDGALIVAFLSGDTGTGATGALLLSRWARPGSLYAKDYDPASLLGAVEDMFALDRLGAAKRAPAFARLLLPSAFPPL